MLDFLFLILFILFPFIILFLYKVLLNENLLKINILNFLIVNLFVFSYIGIVFLYFHIDPLRVAFGVIDKDVIFKIWMFSALSVLSLIVGSWFAKISVRKPSVKLSIINENTKIQRYKSYFFISIGIVFLVSYLKQIPDIAIFNILSDTKSDVQALRSNMGNNFEGSYHWYKLFMRDMLTLFLFSFYAQWLMFKKNTDLYVVILLVIVNVFTSIMATEKAPIIWLLVGLFLVRIFIRNDGIIPLKSILKIIIPLNIILIIMYMFFMKSMSVAEAFNSILSRAFTGSITPAYFYLELFPENMDYLYGRSFPNPASILPYDPVRLTVVVMDWVNPALAQLGIVGSMPTVFWAEVYANFGSLLIVPVAFTVGFLITLFEIFIFKFRKLPMFLGYYIWVILYFRTLSVTGISNYILNISLITLTIVLILISTVRFKLRLAK